MGVLLGGVSSLLYGIGDFLGGEGAKRVSAATVVLWSGLFAIPFITAIALFVGGDARGRDLWIGAAAGAAGALGLVTLFAGLSRGQAAAVAPATAVLSGMVPLVVALFQGERPGPVVWVGVALAVPAIALCSWVAERGEVPLGGVGYGLLAGLGFGAYTAVIDQTSNVSGLLPLIPARAATMVVVGLVSLLGVWKISPFTESPRWIIIGNGIFDVSGNVTLLLALRSGSLAQVSIAASFYPAVTVLMARLVNSEQLRARQILGLVLSLVALAAIASG